MPKIKQKIYPQPPSRITLRVGDLSFELRFNDVDEEENFLKSVRAIELLKEIRKRRMEFEYINDKAAI